MTLSSRLQRWWFAPVPAERLAMLRVLTGTFALIYLIAQAAPLLGYATFPDHRFAPVGVVRLLTEPLAVWIHYVLFGLTLSSCVLFAVGAWFRISGPVFASCLFWLLSYRNSWGLVFHTENLLVLHVLILGLAPAADVWSIDAKPPSRNTSAIGRHGWAIRVLCFVTVIAYFLAGVAKLKSIGFAWADGEVLRTHVAYDALRKLKLGSPSSPVGAWLVSYPWLFTPLGMLTMVLELGAPAALLSGRLGRFWCYGIWGFHLGVWLLMFILFPYAISGVSFAPFFEVERIRDWRWLRRLWPRPAAPVGD